MPIHIAIKARLARLVGRLWPDTTRRALICVKSVCLMSVFLIYPILMDAMRAQTKQAAKIAAREEGNG